ncbi:MAG: hypothetical protein Ta2B_03080 [Termitinemataceae bacterium]|nr:MAG: hypothetical protein Ta2B_03080 [Termitinemataceae bacterium]
MDKFIAAIITAAGTSSRFNNSAGGEPPSFQTLKVYAEQGGAFSTTPPALRAENSDARVKKEYRLLANDNPYGEQLTVLGSAVCAFAECKRISVIVITVPANDESAARAAIPSRFLSASASGTTNRSDIASLPKIYFVPGGISRSISVHNALNFLAIFPTLQTRENDNMAALNTSGAQDCVEFCCSETSCEKRGGRGKRPHIAGERQSDPHIAGERQSKTNEYLELPNTDTVSKPDYVLIHDGARPWVSTNLINKTIDATLMYEAVIPVMPLLETPKEIDSGGFVARHLKRANIVSAQTPQGFNFSKILSAHEKARDAELSENMEWTDDGEIWGQFVGKCAIIEGEKNNKKITFADDI